MMAYNPEQVGGCRYVRSRRAGQYRQFAKKMSNRTRRHAEKVDPEGAPTRSRYRGYAD
jgi:hypothetical protein